VLHLVEGSPVLLGLQVPLHGREQLEIARCSAFGGFE